MASRCEEDGEAKKLPIPRSSRLAHFVAGGVAGAVATILTSPLEVVKTRMQGTGNFVGHVRAMTTPSVSEGWMRSFAHSSDTLASIRHVLHVEGWHGLFRGLGPNLSGVAPARAIYFAVYSETKSLLSRRWGDTAATHVVAATAAGWATATSLNPVWLIKTRLQLQGGGIHGMSSSGYKNSFDCVRRVYREEGLRGLWSGVTASYWGTSETVLYFLMYERMKSWIARKAHKEKEDVGPIELFALSGISKLVATVATYPHEVARTRLREQRSQANRPRKYTGFWQCLQRMTREEGWRALYAGIGAHVTRVVPNTAIMFLSYEYLVRYMTR